MFTEDLRILNHKGDTFKAGVVDFMELIYMDLSKEDFAKTDRLIEAWKLGRPYESTRTSLTRIFNYKKELALTTEDYCKFSKLTNEIESTETTAELAALYITKLIKEV